MRGGVTLAAAREAGRSLMDYRREQLPLLLSREGCRYVAGHFPYSRAAHRDFSSDWRFITILREPVDRWLSQYFYNRYKNAESFRTDLDLATYVARARRSTAFSSKLTDISRYQFWRDPVRSAIDTLEKLDAVGCLERVDEFKEDLGELVGAEIQIGHERPNPCPVEERRKIVTPEIRRRVEELCVDDTKIYRHALGMVDRRSTNRARSKD